MNKKDRAVFVLKEFLRIMNLNLELYKHWQNSLHSGCGYQRIL